MWNSGEFPEFCPELQKRCIFSPGTQVRLLQFYIKPYQDTLFIPYENDQFSTARKHTNPKKKIIKFKKKKSWWLQRQEIQILTKFGSFTCLSKGLESCTISSKIACTGYQRFGRPEQTIGSFNLLSHKRQSPTVPPVLKLIPSVQPKASQKVILSCPEYIKSKKMYNQCTVWLFLSRSAQLLIFLSVIWSCWLFTCLLPPN